MSKASAMSGLCVLGSLLAAAPAHADECKAVDLAVQNGKSFKINALRMDYIFDNDNEWRTEWFPDVEVAAGAFRTVAFDQNLAGGEGNELLGLVLHYQAWCHGSWTSEITSPLDDQFDNTSVCESFNQRSYRIDLPGGVCL